MADDLERAIPTGVATGIGSLPGTDFAEALRTVLGELPEWPVIPELPERDPAASMLPRGAGVLVDLPIQHWVGRWQLADRPGIDMQRIGDFWARDLDTLHEIAGEHDGPLRLTCAGPWTMAAGIWRRTGGAMVADAGAVRDLTESLTEGLRQRVAEIAERIPRARLSLQLDEPSLPAVIAGQVPTESSFGFYRPVETDVVRERLRTLIDAVEVPVVVHCCAAGVPLNVLREAGAAAAAIDLHSMDLNDATQLDALGENLDAGLRLIAGVIPATETEPLEGKAAASIAADLWNRLGFPASKLAKQISLSPTCGLAGIDLESARDVMYRMREAAKYLHD